MKHPIPVPAASPEVPYVLEGRKHSAPTPALLVPGLSLACRRVALSLSNQGSGLPASQCWGQRLEQRGLNHGQHRPRVDALVTTARPPSAPQCHLTLVPAFLLCRLPRLYSLRTRSSGCPLPSPTLLLLSHFSASSRYSKVPRSSGHPDCCVPQAHPGSSQASLTLSVCVHHGRSLT